MWSLVTFEYFNNTFLQQSLIEGRGMFSLICFGEEAPKKREPLFFANKRYKHHQALWLNLVMRGSDIFLEPRTNCKGKDIVLRLLNSCSDVFWRWFKNKNFLPVHQFFSLLLATKSCCPIMCVQDWISPFQEKDRDSIDQVSGLKVEIRNYPDSLGPKT